MILNKILLTLISISSIFIFQIEGASNVTCPNVTVELNATLEDVTGLWYLYSAQLDVVHQDLKCIFANATLINGTLYTVFYATSRSTNELRISYGTVTFGPRPGETIIKYTHPVEFSMAYQYFGGPMSEYSASYICNDCDNYGQNNAGVHPYFWTRIRKPNCTVTDRAFEIYHSFNISTDLMKQIEQDDCTI